MTLLALRRREAALIAHRPDASTTHMKPLTLASLGVPAKQVPEDLEDSHVVANVQRLHSTPLDDFTVDDLRYLIGQRIGLEHLVPRALTAVEADPLVEGSLYRGDLFAALLSVPDAFWSDHPNLNNQLVAIGQELQALAETLNMELLPGLERRQHLAE